MGCTHRCPCRSSETPATSPGGLHRRRRQDLAELHLTDRPGRVLVEIRRTNYTAWSSVPCMSYSISWGIAAVHQAAYGARYAVLARSRGLSTTSGAPRRYGAPESEVALARMTYGIDRGSYHVFYHIVDGMDSVPFAYKNASNESPVRLSMLDANSLCLSDSESISK